MAAWLAARGNKSALAALGDAPAVARETARAEAVVLILGGVEPAVLPADALAGKPVLPIVTGETDPALVSRLQNQGAGLVLKPVVLGSGDCHLAQGGFVALVEALGALALAADFCRRLEEEKCRVRENLALAACFASAPLLA